VTTWLPDPSHYPEQMTPLSATVWLEAVGHGLHEAARELRAPFGGFSARTELGWAYELEHAPEWTPDDAVLRAAALGLTKRWDRELLPRVREITREIERMRPERPPPADAAALLDRLWELTQELWVIHFLTVVPAQIAAEILHDEYVALRSDDDELAAYRLLEGIENPADDAVVELAALARELGVDDLIVEHAPDGALERLRDSAPGRRWLHALEAYLLRFGGRARWHELSVPREAEHPAMTLAALRLLLESDGARETRPSSPQPPPELAEVAERARAAYALKELHTYEIDYPGLLAVRETLLAFGRRLRAEGHLDEVDDVWLLERDELRRIVAGEDLPVGEIVAARRDELVRGLHEGPRPFLGDVPPADADRNAAFDKFYGSGRSDGGALRGTPASPGEAVGPIRIVHGVADVARVEPGDVLVAVTTTPAWTPLFGSIGALVTETGGILSHAAVVAREYRIPAVVGVPAATTRLADGLRVRVDGSTGEVHVI
jgi:phosphohistidine swiveling domain-containing protein